MTTQIQTKGPFRYDVVGSLLRTDALKQAHADFNAGKIDQAKLIEVQHAETDKIVKKQLELGFKAVTDGEFNRSWWHLDFLWGLKGTDEFDYHQSYKFKGANTRTNNVELNGKVAYNPDHPFFASFKYLKSLVPEGVLAKQTIPTPLMLFRDNRSDRWHEFYENWEDYTADLVTAYRETILHFYELGCRYIQIDDTTWAFLINRLNDTKDQPEEHDKYVSFAKEDVKILNAVLKDLPEDLTITTHICRGNFKSTYLFEGGYDAIAKHLGELNYDGLFLEYDNERSGDFTPLKEIWNNDPNKILVLGLITSKFPELEDVADVIKRINDAAIQVPLANLALSTQCGFASTEEGNQLTAEQQWDKLRLVKRVAEDVWGK